MTKNIWIVSSTWYENEESIDRKKLVSEGVIGGQYENIRLYDELKLRGFNVKLVNPNTINAYDDFVILNGKTLNNPDLIILRQTNSIIDHCIKKIKVKCINDLNAHNLCAHKKNQYYALKKYNIPMPKTEFIDIPFDDNDIDYKSKLIGDWPLIAKPLWGQRGDLVTLCHDASDVYTHALKIKRKYSNNMMLQQYMKCPTIVAWVIGDEIKSAQIRSSKNGGFFISNDRESTIREKYTVNEKLKSLINLTTKALGVEIARIDIFENSGDYMICEVNSPGGYAGRDDYFNSNHAADIARYVENLI